ncbi:f1ac9281-717a-4415-9bb4-cf7478e90e03 [Thermothielavioides terrestris]|uniref:F1ac9281-717a-4415-9bb4-cf7478e90e03 n=1 Tax=Thermothielavioides terrestris TaxID=2587410 RepID=A0A3S4ALM4_9PEZI|nr:f1ac9281-717a-4415-9bb4-cf7478e90e03 [Thermothielavioides terrestris]
MSRPRVILGLMTFGPDEAAGARVTDPAAFTQVLDRFQARGYGEVDTARTYVGGRQEGCTRAAGWRERGLRLATKVRYPAAGGENTAEGDRATPFAETLRAINELHQAGKFVRFGLSNFTAFEVAEIVMTCKYNGWVRPTVYQAMYNAITRAIEPELVVACRRYGLDIVVYNPIAGGLFSGKIKSRDMVPAEGRFSDKAASGRMYRDRYYRDSTFRALQVVEQAVEKAGLTMIETALRWVVHHSALRVTDGNDGVIIGVSSLEQLEANLTDLEKGPLPDEVVRALDEAWAINKADAPVYWHKELKYTYDTQEALFGTGAQ